jgi:phosphatidate cytidylyltransferase
LIATALVTVAALFAFGGAMIAAFGRRAPAPAELWQHYVSEVAIVGAVLIPAATHRYAFLAVVLAAAGRCAWEVAVLYRRASRPVAERLLAVAFPLIGAACLAYVSCRDAAFGWIFLLFAVTETQDAMAWLFGRLFGRRLIFPNLSPRKTLEGALAGIAGAVAVGVAVARLGLGLDWAPAIGCSLLIAVSGLAGDLLASLLKRRVGAKDFPPVHRLHGGLLDIYDAFLFAAIPLGAVLWIADPGR